MVSQELRLSSPDQNAISVYRSADETRTRPVVIYCHGWAGTRKLGTAGEHLRDELLERNCVLVTIDMYGCGETGGNYSLMTYGRWADNLSDLVSWVARQSWADSSRVGFFGISSGTTAAFRVAIDQTPAFVISVATAIGYYIGMPNNPALKLLTGREALEGNGTVELFGTRFPMGFYDDFIRNAPIHRISTVRCPVLFLQGQNDNIYRKSDALIGYSQICSERGVARYQEIEGGDHSIANRYEERNRTIVSWLVEIGIL